jgi:hypothetical protein
LRAVESERISNEHARSIEVANAAYIRHRRDPVRDVASAV